MAPPRCFSVSMTLRRADHRVFIYLSRKEEFYAVNLYMDFNIISSFDLNTITVMILNPLVPSFTA